MRMQVFAVFDRAVGAFLPPFFSRARGEAIRSFTEACNDDKHSFNKHSADFQLMFLGEFDDASGQFETADPSRLVSASDVLEDDPFTEDKKLPSHLRPVPM